MNSDHELDGKWHKLAMEHYKQLILQFCILRKLYLLFEVSFLSVYSALVGPSLACQYNVISYNLINVSTTVSTSYLLFDYTIQFVLRCVFSLHVQKFLVFVITRFFTLEYR